MPEKISPSTRSKIMSRIRSKWTKPERKIHNLLKGHKVRHIMHPKLQGNPDAFLIEQNIVLFIDGCFWHNCPYHGHIPESNRGYWGLKLQKNKNRDEKYSLELKLDGYKVVRVWECEIMKKEFNGKAFLNHLFD